MDQRIPARRLANGKMIGVDGDRRRADEARIGADLVDDANTLGVALLEENANRDVAAADVVAKPGVEIAQGGRTVLEVAHGRRRPQAEQPAQSVEIVGEPCACVWGGKEHEPGRLASDLLPLGRAVPFGRPHHLLDHKPAEAVADIDDRPLAEAVGFQQRQDVAGPIGQRHGTTEPTRGFGIIAERPDRRPITISGQPQRPGPVRAAGASPGAVRVTTEPVDEDHVALGIRPVLPVDRAQERIGHPVSSTAPRVLLAE